MSAYDPAQPYASARSPMVGRNAVATSQPLATQAGIRALRDGGNAIDAALAAAITLTVVEPNNNGIGSDAFALIWSDGALHGLNGSGRAPEGWTRQRFAGRTQMPGLGWDTVTVPGAVSAWAALSERFGALPFADLFRDAITYARDGFHVGPKSAFYWQFAPRQYADYPDFLAHFCPDGRAPRAGERFVPAGMADTLTAIAADRGRSFYEGALAERTLAASAAAGGALCARDLAAHRADWVAPIDVEFAGARLHEIPPNGQGLGALIAAGVLERLDAGALAVDSADATHLQIEAARIGIREAFAHIADIEAMHLTPAQLLDGARLDALAAGIDRRRADPRPLRGGAAPDTVYLTTADADGRMVSLIQSNYQGFGSGIVVPGTGIALQNRGSGFVLDAEHPNCVGPGKRPFHTIIPGFVTRDGAPLLSFGVMGGHMQHQGHLQMLVRCVLWGQNPQAASDAPRWHVREDGRVAVEAAFDAAVIDDLRARGHVVEIEEAEHVFGGAQLIQRLADGAFCAGSDHRKEGSAAVF
ncbi:MAG TPA: gamma-glutamyltransferase family protein [Pseudomonadales bacterium]|nr:gamma-glutamyltransferase family protein [Pseudomonadales bacterium]